MTKASLLLCAAAAAALALALASPAAAFAPPGAAAAAAALGMSSSSAASSAAADRSALPKMSQAVPFLVRPDHLDGTLAGDLGFDPLGLSSNDGLVMYYREAEIKHARLAMLGAAGWPLSELFDGRIAGALGLHPLLDGTARAPSPLSSEVSPAWWGFCLGLAAAIDVAGIRRSRAAGGQVGGFEEEEEAGYEFPGDLGYDPLGLYPADAVGRRRMQLAEIKHGRVAMVAVLAFALQEYIGKEGVVLETPIFFVPITETLRGAMEGLVVGV